MAVFPDYFPDDFQSLVDDAGGKKQAINVYRVSKEGILTNEAFLCSIKEDEINKRERVFESPLDAYSTSCFEKLREIKNVKKFFMKRSPKAIILCGVTHPDCGPSQRTSERKADSSHVDWWLYEDSNPCIYFSEVV